MNIDQKHQSDPETVARHKAITRDGVVFNYYPKDRYFECAYCCHGWTLHLNGDQAPANAANYCPNCGHKVKAVVVIDD